MTHEAPRMTVADLQLLADGGAADLPSAVLQLLEQGDPDTGPLPQGALDADTLKSELERASTNADAQQGRVEVALAWRRYLTQTNPPPAPRFLLADFLVALYERGDEPSRAALVELIKDAPLRLGLWGGLKRIFKLAEARHDALLFGALAARIDREVLAPSASDVSKGTLLYLRRRAWRSLRHLGQALPELYPQFAAATLAQYPVHFQLAQSWVASHIVRTRAPHDAYSFASTLPADLLQHRAFDDAWKAPHAADVLLVLLEQCHHDAVARFAIQGLQRDFPQALRALDAGWLGRVARRPLGSVHEFLVATFESVPEYHAARLLSLGLHETALSLLLSPSAKARSWAIEYARAHAQDLGPGRLVEYAKSDFQDTQRWAASALSRLAPKAIGHELLASLLGTALGDWAGRALENGFDRSELPRPWLMELLWGTEAQSVWAQGYLTKKFAPTELGADFWKSVLADRRARDEEHDVDFAFKALLASPPEAIGGEWLLEALAVSSWHSTLLPWLERVESLPGVNVERLKGLVFDPRLRAVALRLLGRPRIAPFAELGLPWLLALARRADPTLNQWASRYLLENVSPRDFAEGDAAKGVERLLELATGPREPEPVRAFAQGYLACHHPTVGPEQPLAVSFQLKPQLTLEAYRPEPYWKALFDPRPDVRRFAVLITKASLRPWGWHTRVYELADSEHKEVRLIAFDALLKAGQAGADPRCTLEPTELEAAPVFALTESRIKSTRELAMELIARHSDTLGGPERLAWLMASADRTVRQMAVRLLWQRHRPRGLPQGWKPKGEALAPLDDVKRFGDVEALRSFLRALLFGLPPGRAAEPAESAHGVRRVPAGIAKQRAIEAAKDLALDDETFARVLSPLLSEFTGSVARGEWQTCLSALVALQRAYPALDLGLTKGA